MEDQTISITNFVTYKKEYHLPDRVLKEFMAEIRGMDVREDDIFIASFPKSGTHWVQEIVNLILVNGYPEKIPSYRVGRTVIEMADVAMPSLQLLAFIGPSSRQMRDAPSPRILTTHVTRDCLPKDLCLKRCKIIYVYRNPKDVIVSYYNHRRKFTAKEQGIPTPHSPMLFAKFFRTMTSEYNLYSGWFNHVTEYLGHRQEENYFMVSYEEMKEDLAKVVKHLAKFIGKDVDSEALDRIMKASSLEAMKTVYQTEQNDNMKEGKPAMDATLILNEGKVGQWQNLFSAEQNKQFDRMFLENIHDEELLKAYGPESS